MFIKRFAVGSAALVLVSSVMLSAAALLPRTPLISLSSNAGNATAALGGPELGSSNDKMMINPVSYSYEAGAGLSDATGDSHVYQLVLDGSPESALRRVANAFEMAGEVQRSRQWNPNSPSYFVGSEDGSSPSANLWWGGTGNWFYNNFAEDFEPPCKKIQTADDGTEFCGEYVEQKPTPELLPSEEQILRDAIRIFRATGLEVSKNAITPFKDEWSAGASASLKVNGQDTAIAWGIGYDSKGRLSWASGHSVRVLDRGAFPTISAKSAVTRLSDWRWYGSPAVSEYPVYPVTSRDFTTGQEPASEPAEVTVTITSSKPLLLQIWDKDFGSWLVPGFALGGKESSVNFVVSLIEGVIELPEPVAIEPEILPQIDEPFNSETSTK